MATQTSRRSHELIVATDLEALSQTAAERFVALAQRHDPFTVALSGGSTPGRLYALLAASPFREQIPWESVHIFWGDERCVPPEDPGSNYRLACEALLDHVPLPERNIHRVRGEWEPEVAAQAYTKDLRGFFQASWPVFNLVLLGMGSDGHTASLFPGSDALREGTRPAVGVIANYQDRPARRVTLTAPAINAAQEVIFLVSGADKAETLQAVLEGPYQPYNLPAQLVQPTQGQLLWLVDNAAGRKVKHLV